MKKIGKAIVFIMAVLMTLSCNPVKEHQKKEHPKKKPEFQNMESKEVFDHLNDPINNSVNNPVNDPNWKIIDTRDSNAFNGWILGGEKRGGHIKGALNLDVSWINANELGLKMVVEQRGINEKSHLILYGYKMEDNEKLAKWLVKRINIPVKNIRIYGKGIVQWSKDKKYPMERLARYDKLVYPGWIQKLTDTGKKYKLLEVSFGEGKDYKNDHIPGAFHFDTSLIEEGPMWNIKSPDKIESVMLQFGITKDSQVILYGKDTTAAARVAVVLMCAGVDDVRILNGGFKAWTKAGFPVQKKINLASPVKSFGCPIPKNPDYIVNMVTARNILNDKNGRLVSIRSWLEQTGMTSGYKYIKPKGRIKGDVWGHGGSDPWHMQDFRNPDDTMADYHAILKFWKNEDITPDKKIAFYCGTGWRASEAFFDAYLMGFENISVYDCGWLEWSADPLNPIF
ncbi:MAG: thiosulfate sulfurtransferase [Desulfobacteraceae bacterium]|nr:thiosulfate sulfurtransferase [Desulfobacteraceae bacterium]